VVTSRNSCHFVTFRLGRETYALDVTHAREVVDDAAVTPIPNTPRWVRGVLNLRGTILPVLDIKQKFHIEGAPEVLEPCILVVEVQLEGETHAFGLCADAVREVFEFDFSELRPSPRFCGSLSAEFVRGIGEVSGEIFVVLDVEKVFSAAEVSRIAESAA
jgi:purine-binding chemotaxis protein CheW